EVYQRIAVADSPRRSVVKGKIRRELRPCRNDVHPDKANSKNTDGAVKEDPFHFTRLRVNSKMTIVSARPHFSLFTNLEEKPDSLKMFSRTGIPPSSENIR